MLAKELSEVKENTASQHVREHVVDVLEHLRELAYRAFWRDDVRL